MFRDREPFNPPADTVNGFLGYFDLSSRQTTCGNCHTSHQADWESTKHAGAWATLQNTGRVQAFCQGCHTTSDRGNVTAAPAGYDAKADPAYQDVQCESCHGPGLNHVTRVLNNPDSAGAAPALAHISASGDSVTVSVGCGACHSGVHQPFVEEWSQSGHAVSLELAPGRFVADQPDCATCHEGRAVLTAWGVNSSYAERDSAGSAHFKGITCAVCHNPHGSANPAQLRFPLSDASVDNNLCMKCHSRRAEPSTGSSRGPHAPQGPVLLGTAGWWPPGFDTNAVTATHGNVNANPELCAGCHVLSFTGTDSTGAFQFQATGHLFQAAVCVDATGRPTGNSTCAFAPAAPGVAGRRLGSCATGGCHANDVNQVATAFNRNRQNLEAVAAQMWVDVDGDEAPTPGVDTGLLPDGLQSGKIPGTEFSTTDNRITVAEGVLFNLRMVGPGRYANGDRSNGVHNPLLAQSLVAVSLQALTSTYGLPAPPASLQRLLDEIVDRMPPGLAARFLALQARAVRVSPP